MTILLITTILWISMAQQFWQLAVAYPLKNHKFRVGTNMPETIESVPAANQLQAGDGTWEDFSASVQKGDSVSVGPNSGGQSENAIVQDIQNVLPGSKLRVTLEDNLVNTYLSGDAFRAYGTKLAGGWLRTAGASTSRLQPNGINRIIRQRTHDYAQLFSHGSSQSGDFSLASNLDENILREYAWHRFGLSYRLELLNSSGNAKLFLKHINTLAVVTTETIASTDTLSWTAFASSPFFTENKNGGNQAAIHVGVTRQTNDELYVWIGNSFLEHAQGVHVGQSTLLKSGTDQGGGSWSLTLFDNIGSTGFDVVAGDQIAVDDGNDSVIVQVTSAVNNVIGTTLISGTATGVLNTRYARLQKKNNGYFELDQYHEPESLQIDIIDQVSPTVLADGSVRIFGPMMDGDRSKRHILGCRFENVSQNTWDSVNRLLHHQQRGSLINLHPKGFDDLPPVMTGRMKITPLSKAFWDLGHHAFDFLFEETWI